MATWLKIALIAIAVVAVVTAVVILAPAVITAVSTATTALATSGGMTIFLSVGGAIGSALTTADAITVIALVATACASIAMVESDGQIFQTKQSGKEKSTDKPSWVNRGLIDQNLSAQQNAETLLNNKYGKGGRGGDRGPGSEYNQIVKWLIRSKILHNLTSSTSRNQIFQNDKQIFDWWGGNR